MCLLVFPKEFWTCKINQSDNLWVVNTAVKLSLSLYSFPDLHTLCLVVQFIVQAVWLSMHGCFVNCEVLHWLFFRIASDCCCQGVIDGSQNLLEKCFVMKRVDKPVEVTIVWLWKSMLNVAWSSIPECAWVAAVLLPWIDRNTAALSLFAFTMNISEALSCLLAKFCSPKFWSLMLET